MPSPLPSAAFEGAPESGPGAAAQPLRIAILLNSYRSRFLPAIRNSYERTLGGVCPAGTESVFFEPANRQGDFPDPARFDLIVVGGSNVNPRKSHPWILEVHEFLRGVVRRWPQRKILGICWGHQTICRVFGGVVVDAAVPEMGVATVGLTEQGRQFFHEAAVPGCFKLHQHHRREVAAAPPGFAHLARGNQCLLNASNTILTFQGHPEKDAETARLRMHDSMRWFGFDAVDEKAWARLEQMIEMEHDGDMVWRRILDWVREPPAVLDVSEVEKSSKI
ncbi:Uu.00g003890.m01.CDS01 [Anthostomella pinea]|uniref:Uu.00g003890.m01.CDS01 n=1 Tax=Anthostomella pinea TaxID=933095 RepID=A0AAI8VJW0_9PEZI|nr:Uu.00g003890.m01.CDS01 [Anthostomella pinea]